MSSTNVTRLSYIDEELACLALPRDMLRVTRGLGSGLSRHHGDRPGVLWAIGDRGPNLKMPLAIDRYGLEHLAKHAQTDGAKLMPCPEIGPAIVELQFDCAAVRMCRVLPLRDTAGHPLSGLPPAGSDARAAEPAIGLDGAVLTPDPGGADTEGLAIAPDGSFWVGEEYGPSLFHIAHDGTVRTRWVPAGTETLFEDAAYPVVGALPPLAARRRLNRGFEGLSLSEDGSRLHVAFQSPLAHPNDDVGRHARHVRLWTLDALTGALLAEHLYPLDKPNSFERDVALGDVDRADVKLCDMAAVEPSGLIVLERVSASAKLYLVKLEPSHALPERLGDPASRPTLEEMSADSSLECATLNKRLLFSTDDHPEIGPDLEGLAILDERSVLLVNDNDFGIEGVATSFWRVEMTVPFASSWVVKS